MKKTAKIIKFDPAEVARTAAAQATSPADKRRPLTRDSGTPAEYPLDATGPLRPVIEAIRMKTQAPISMIASSVIAAAALAVAPHFDIELLSGRTPLTVACLSIAESGERKTSVDAFALAPIRKMEAENAAGYDEKVADWLADREAWKCAADHAKKNGKGNRVSIRIALEALGPEPSRPPSPMVLISDATSEGITNHLVDHNIAGVFSSEGGTILGGHGMSDDSKLQMAALLNSGWGGEAIRRSRAATGATLLLGRRIVLHLMAQPGVAEILTADPVMNDVGLLARMLIVAPASTAGTRTYRQAPPEADAVLSGWNGRITCLIGKPPRLLDGGGLDPGMLPLHPDARKMLIAFHDYAERGLAPDGEFSNIRAFGSKMAEHAGRLAGIMAVYDDPELVEISADHMANGTRLATFYAGEMKRLAEGASISPDLKLARKLLEWWQARSDPRCHLASIYQIGPNAIRESSAAKRSASILEDHGWIERLEPGTILDGAPRRDAWRLT